MSDQILILPATFYTFEIAPTPENPPCRVPIMASSLDYGFDFDADELARELLAPLPVFEIDHSNHSVEAEEFDSLYKWFCA